MERDDGSEGVLVGGAGVVVDGEDRQLCLQDRSEDRPAVEARLQGVGLDTRDVVRLRRACDHHGHDVAVAAADCRHDCSLFGADLGPALNGLRVRADEDPVVLAVPRQHGAADLEVAVGLVTPGRCACGSDQARHPSVDFCPVVHCLCLPLGKRAVINRALYHITPFLSILPSESVFGTLGSQYVDKSNFG